MARSVGTSSFGAGAGTGMIGIGVGVIGGDIGERGEGSGSTTELSCSLVWGTVGEEVLSSSGGDTGDETAGTGRLAQFWGLPQAEVPMVTAVEGTRIEEEGVEEDDRSGLLLVNADDFRSVAAVGRGERERFEAEDGSEDLMDRVDGFGCGWFFLVLGAEVCHSEPGASRSGVSCQIFSIAVLILIGSLLYWRINASKSASSIVCGTKFLKWFRNSTTSRGVLVVDIAKKLYIQ